MLLKSAVTLACGAAALLLPTPTRAQTCAVEQNAVDVFDYTSFTGVDTHVIIPASITGSGAIQVAMAETTGGTSAQVWLAKQERVTDGFIASFTFTVDGTGDGVAFVVQNDKTEDTAGGTQLNLGFRDGLDRYLGVAFETCSNFAEPCSGQRVAIYEMGQASEGDMPIEVANGTVARDMRNGLPVNAQIIYNQNNFQVEVKVDGASVATGVLTASLESIFGSRFGWFGFSSSTTGHPTPFFLTADTTVSSFRLQTQPSDVAVGSKLGEKVDWGRSYTFDVIRRDSCLNQIPFVGNVTIRANLTKTTDVTNPADLVAERDILFPVITPSPSGGYALRFDLPFRTEATWRLAAEVNGIPIANTPINAAVISSEPAPATGLPTWGLILLICIISLIVLGTVYGIVRLRRYRRKLKENEENIEAGKEKHKLDVLDRAVEYSVNPMLGTLDEMKRKLADNEKTLERMRQGKAGAEEDAQTVDELNRQNKQLRDEMNKLKKEAQQEDAGNADFSGEMDAAPKSDKKQFGQSRA